MAVDKVLDEIVCNGSGLLAMSFIRSQNLLLQFTQVEKLRSPMLCISMIDSIIFYRWQEYQFIGVGRRSFEFSHTNISGRTSFVSVLLYFRHFIIFFFFSTCWEY